MSKKPTTGSRRRSKGLLLALAVIVIVGATLVLIRELSSSSPGCNVILISLDTCRADYLSCYGYDGNTTPNIDSVAGDGFLFENAITTVPLTLPAHSSMLTGTIPLYHGVRANSGFRLGGTNETLAELLRDGGHVTGGIVGVTIMGGESGLDQGFDSFEDVISGQVQRYSKPERRGEECSALAVDWLEEHQREPFFLFVHYYDPHDPYEPPEPYSSSFADNPYAGEIAYTDHCVGIIIEKLKSLKLYDSSFIIITGDHGESFGEHGEEKHGYFIYNPTMRVPLVMKPPGRCNARSVSDLVGLVDIVPTVLGHLGISQPRNIHGKDLCGYFHDGAPRGKGRYMYCESMYPSVMGLSSLHGIVSDRWKYIQTSRPELYDFAGDQAEANNVIARNRQEAELMKNRLEKILEQIKPVEIDSSCQGDEEDRNRLRGLGYLGAGISEIVDLDEGRGDPKDYVGVSNELIDVMILLEMGKRKEVAAKCREILQSCPELGIVHGLLASVLEQDGELDESIDHFREAIAFKYGNNYDQAMLHFLLAGALSKKQKNNEALGHYQKALTLSPDLREAHCHLGATLFALGRIEESMRSLNKALEIDPDYSEAHYRLAMILERSGNIPEAILHFRRSVKLEPEQPEPAICLARILATRRARNPGDGDEAVELAKRANELTGYENPFFLKTLAQAYVAAGEKANAVKTARKALDLARSAGKRALVSELERFVNSAR
jgi:arylsulfatase A-like enzyme/Flp pilus assembly protein TadD